MTMTAIVFFGSLLLLIYIYLGYPLFIALLAVLRPKPVRKHPFEPSVTILIAAYNEEGCIGDTIRNKLALDYPKDKLEIIVVSDGSDDGTDAIVQSFSGQGVKLLRQKPRQGKTAALNYGVQQAQGEIILFSDANSMYEPDALRFLANNFHDPEVGYVTGKMIYMNEDGSVIGDGCSMYMKYENFLRAYETKVGSIVGVDGGIDAVRKFLYQPMKPDQLPDFVLPLKVVEQGYRVVYEPLALLKEPALQNSRDEYRMRVRVTLRALWALRDMFHLFNIGKHRLFAWQLLSHKFLRYLAFVFLAGLYSSSALLWAGNELVALIFVAQNLFYFAVLASYFLGRFGFSSKLFYVPYYFTLINLASAHAFVKFFRGHKTVLWTPRKG